MNTIKSLEQKEATLIQEIEAAEFELVCLNEFYQETGENQLEEKAGLYTKLSQMSKELLSIQIEMDNLYVEDHLEEIFRYF